MKGGRGLWKTIAWEPVAPVLTPAEQALEDELVAAIVKGVWGDETDETVDDIAAHLRRA